MSRDYTIALSLIRLLERESVVCESIKVALGAEFDRLIKAREKERQEIEPHRAFWVPAEGVATPV